MPKLESFTVSYAERRSSDYQVVEIKMETTGTLLPGEKLPDERERVLQTLKTFVRQQTKSALAELVAQQGGGQRNAT